MFWKVVGGPLPARIFTGFVKKSFLRLLLLIIVFLLRGDPSGVQVSILSLACSSCAITGGRCPWCPVHRHQICTTNPPTLLIQVLCGSKKTPEMRTFFFIWASLVIFLLSTRVFLGAKGIYSFGAEACSCRGLEPAWNFRANKWLCADITSSHPVHCNSKSQI